MSTTSTLLAIFLETSPSPALKPERYYCFDNQTHIKQITQCLELPPPHTYDNYHQQCIVFKPVYYRNFDCSSVSEGSLAKPFPRPH